ncbi:ThiF family adenylyltransferase [Edaphobacter aggregans]|uniref:ThiF family adenylyltransferase n=1 Tax=Edaphobacter aggregans TaxID=570835 RepID=UPI000551BD16|nr:ThiF family adenylyltransferase [Edaphobacter aggregans]
MNIDARYSRQELFSPIGPEGQARIRAARVLIAGCGGLGSNSANVLARAGVGFLRIVDRDLVELTNLERQLLFEESDARDGAPKAVAAARHLAAINSEVRVESVVADIGTDNIFDLLQGIDLVLDGFDNLQARYLLNDACTKHNVPWIYASCVSATVMAGLFVPGKTACFRCLHRDLPEPGAVRTCDMAGIIAPAALVAASIQASIALRFLTGKALPETSLIVADAWDLSLDRIVVSRDENCPCCALKQFDFLNMAGQQAITLCGRNAVQVRAVFERRPDFKALAGRLGAVGAVRVNDHLLRLDAPPYELTLFEDGRVIVKGTPDPKLARSLVARWVGV